MLIPLASLAPAEHCPGGTEPWWWCKTCCCRSSPDAFLLAGWPVTLLIGTKQLPSVPVYFLSLSWVFSPGFPWPEAWGWVLVSTALPEPPRRVRTRCFLHLLRRIFALLVQKEMASELWLCKLNFRANGMQRAICITGKLLLKQLVECDGWWCRSGRLAGGGAPHSAALAPCTAHAP